MSFRGCSVAIEAEPALHGLLNIFKPSGMTSRDAVDRVVRSLRLRFPKPQRLPKAGHAGTLDPLAAGVLLVGVGAGVRLVPYLHLLDKDYRAKFRLGESSQSGDLETPVTPLQAAAVPTRDALETAAEGLTGLITQIPPAHSAVKVGGRKAYRFAHRGQAVEVPSRQVRVDLLKVENYAYPEVELTIRCGTGTYVRTLGIDLAKACRTTAVMTDLVRTRIGGFGLESAVTLDRIEADPEGLEQALLPLALGVTALATVTLDDEAMTRLCHGVKIDASEAALEDSPPADDGGREYALLDRRGLLRVVAELSQGRFHPRRVFPEITTPR